jgi:outer membrane protein OmpA-like peptidoglycan-associated protein
MAAACWADQPPVPAYVTFPSQAKIKPGWTEEDYGAAEFVILGQPSAVQRGKHWNGGITFSGVPSGADPEVVWAQFKPSLVNGGWVFFRDAPGQAKTARYQKNGLDSWILIWVFSADDIRYDVVEAGPLPASLKLALTKPAAKPETVTPATGDFPYLSPMAGCTFQAGSQDDSPMMVEIDANNHEARVGATGSITKSYSVPPPLRSPLTVFTVYHDALALAGWTIVHQVPGATNSSDSALTAHYSANGRDIWTTLHGGGDNYTIQVGDNGAQDLGAQLDKDCHVALYGINFDFNKSTLRPDSDPVLEKVLALLQARADLKLEVQGHTDNVGGDDYNQKLSEARAGAVVAWLQSKGIAESRLTAHGYGSKVPIADNGSDEGRAKNRRVELKKQGCGT